MNKLRSNSENGLIAKRSNRRFIAGLTAAAVIALCAISCSPEAPWTTRDVQITIDVQQISAGFIECQFSTNKNAYYLVACEPAIEGVNPMEYQKQFMMLALDSANVKYLMWRNQRLKEGEFNVAPFASHALQYGAVHYVFTPLQANTHYWLYAFVVDPDKMEPVGRLNFQNIYTTTGSTVDIHFEYRIKGRWDYIYPLDKNGNIYNAFPYIAITRDSLEIDQSGDLPTMYFSILYIQNLKNLEEANILYGVKVAENDGFSSPVEFEMGHTYYTYISGMDGSYNHKVLYRFKWYGDSTSYYFKEDASELESNTGI